MTYQSLFSPASTSYMLNAEYICYSFLTIFPHFSNPYSAVVNSYGLLSCLEFTAIASSLIGQG